MKFLLLTGFLTLLVSCGSVQKYPLSKFSFSETAGLGRARFEMGATRAIRLQPSEDLRAQTVSQTPLITRSVAPYMKPTLGITDSIETEFYFGPQQALSSGLKFQFLGAPMSGAGAGNFSLSGRIGYSLYVGAEEINAGESFANPRLDRSMVVDSGYVTYEALIGYRIAAPLLISVSIFKDSGTYNLKFKEGDRTAITHQIKSFGQSLNILYGAGAIQLMGSVARGKFEVSNRNLEEDAITWGLSVGLYF